MWECNVGLFTEVTHTRKSEQIARLQPNRFSQSEHTCETDTQLKTQSTIGIRGVPAVTVNVPEMWESPGLSTKLFPDHCLLDVR